ncbi:MAG: histidine--tRNA ligase [Deltaproteobacteria bacterium]|nr:histidine--tRNA ligase [Deltaproteobacteria bacterium]
MGKLTNLSGFPEWLPEEKAFEERLISAIRRVYEGYGFTQIETPAVEAADTLLSKGVVDKEIYFLHRAKQEGEREEASLGLHFDLTVPFARYVAQHNDKLTFPFKRYQVQKVWRGERPQKGRFREFYQFDIDTVAAQELPLACDAEVLSAFNAAFSEIGLGAYEIRLNSRKVLFGIYEHLKLDAAQQLRAITIVDKLDKIGRPAVQSELEAIGVSPDTAREIVRWCDKKCEPHHLESEIGSEGIDNEQFRQGILELRGILSLMPESSLAKLRIDLSLARGLDYYTGIIFEVHLPDHKEFGAVGSGGRYDNLTAQFTSKRLPGVGASIGITRLVDLAARNGLIGEKRRSPSKAVIAVFSEEQRPLCNGFAEELRSHGVNCEVYFKSPKLGKQIEYSAAKGIPYIVFLDPESKTIELKNIETKQQQSCKDAGECAAVIKGGTES